MGPPATVIVNPAAGGGRARRILPKLIEAAGVLPEVEVVVSDGPGHPAELAREACRRERTVVAAGGDGLVGVVAGVVHEADGLLGVVPIGSGNDYARFLGLDHRNPLSAFGVIAGGRTATLDAARAAGRLYCTVAASGFDAEAARWAQGVRRLRGSALYLAAVARTLATYHPQPFRLTVDGEVHELTAWLVAVACIPNYAGGMQVAPDADARDGLLDVVVVGPVSRFGFVRAFPSVYRGGHTAHPMVEVLRGSVVELEHTDPASELELYADGERVAPFPVTIESVPAALRVLVPAGSRLTDRPPR